jgi:hypothetical protein
MFLYSIPYTSALFRHTLFKFQLEVHNSRVAEGGTHILFLVSSLDPPFLGCLLPCGFVVANVTRGVQCFIVWTIHDLSGTPETDSGRLTQDRIHDHIH